MTSDSSRRLAEFDRRHPRYRDTSPLDELRRREYSRLDREQHV